MIELPVKPGSNEWRQARLGLPTASAFDQIITPARGELSKSSRKYAYRLIAERLLGAPMDSLANIEQIEHGKLSEPDAVRQFEFQQDTETRECGLFLTDDLLIGATPDRVLIGQNVGLEVKSPFSFTVHIGYLLDGPGDAYKPQVQGQLMVCEFDKAYFYSYHARGPAALVETGRDDAYIAKMRDALDAFTDQLAADFERATSLGVFQAYSAGATPDDVERAEQLRDQLRYEIDPALREA